MKVGRERNGMERKVKEGGRGRGRNDDREIEKYMIIGEGEMEG